MEQVEDLHNLADPNKIDPDDPQAGRYNLMTAIQALAEQLPALPLIRTTIGTDEGAYNLRDLGSDLAGFLPETANPIEHAIDIGAPMLGAAAPFVARTIGAGKKAPTKGIRSWHGTPERFAPEEGFPLGRFSNERFRSGEGAMVRGAGHYTGGKVDVPRGYRDRSVEYDTEMMVGDTPVLKIYEDLEHEADVAWPRLPRTVEAQEQGYRAHDLANEKRQVLEDLMIDGDLMGIEERAELGSYSDEALKWFNEEIAPTFNRKGAMAEIDYQVSPEDLLHHDLPFSEQSEEIQDSLTELVYRGSIAPSSGRAHLEDTESVLRWKTDDPAVMKRIEELKAKIEAANDKLGGPQWDWRTSQYKYPERTPQDWLDLDAAEVELTIYLDEAQATGGSWAINPEATGIDIHHAIEQNLRASGMTDEAAGEAASMDMLHAGIKGVKYRDQGSRQPFTVKGINPDSGIPWTSNWLSGSFTSRKEAMEFLQQQQAKVPDVKFQLIDTPEEELTYNYVAFDPDDLMIQRWLALGGTGVGLHKLTEEQRRRESQ